MIDWSTSLRVSGRGKARSDYGRADQASSSKLKHCICGADRGQPEFARLVRHSFLFHASVSFDSASQGAGPSRRTLNTASTSSSFTPLAEAETPTATSSSDTFLRETETRVGAAIFWDNRAMARARSALPNLSVCRRGLGFILSFQPCYRAYATFEAVYQRLDSRASAG